MSDVNYTGRIEKTFPSRFGGGSFSLEGQRGIYFNSKQPLPGFASIGATVSFSGNMGANGKSFFINEGSIQQVQSAPAASAPSGGNGGGGPNTNDRIGYQSSRKDALTMVGLLAAAGVLYGPTTPKGKIAGILEAATDRFTAAYFQDIETLGALDRATAEPEPVAKAAKAKPVAAEPDEDEVPE